MQIGVVRKTCVALAVLGLVRCGLGAEASSRPTSVAASKTAETIAKQREAVAERIVKLSDSKENETSGDAKHKEETLRMLRSLDAVYVQHQARLEQRQQLEAENKQADEDLQRLDKFDPDEPKPYSLLLLENLQDQLEAEEDREDAIDADVKSAERLLESAHDELDDCESDRQKLAKKKAEQENPPGNAATGLLDADLPCSLARAKITLREAEIAVHNLRLDLCKTRQEQLGKKIKVVKKDAKFSASDRDKQLERLAGAEADLNRRRSEVESHLQALESEQKAALKELSDQHAPQAVVDAATESWRIAREAYLTEVVILQQQIGVIASTGRFWKRRYELATSTVERKTLTKWLDDLNEFVDQLKETSRSLEHRRDTAREDQEVAARAESESKDEAAKNWLKMRQTRLQELRDLCAARLDDISATQRMLRRFRGELKTKLSEGSTWGMTAGDTLKWLLGYEVAEVDDESITFGRILILVAVIVAGVILAYLLSRVIGRRLLPQTGMHRGKVAALKSILFYSLCVIFGVLAFRVLHIPLAAFAFLGGAAAIAVGFGGQDIMNNFMSGIILLTEQPIRVGDVIQLDDVQGVVLHIGLRSTRLQTDSNHELIVPNKTLIDDEVTNLTLSDNFVRSFVAISLERSVNIQQAKWKMLEIAFAHPLVIKSPRPAVLLKEVDIYWTTFEVHFWLQHSSFIRCAMVQSQILEAISEVYKPAEEPPTDSSQSATTLPAAASAMSSLQKMGGAALMKEFKRARAAK